MSASAQEIQNLISQEYKQGFVTVLETETFAPGLDEDVIHRLSKVKNEPEFMLEYRLKAFRHWRTMKTPEWAFVKFPPIDYQSISYYSAPKRKEDGPKSLDDIDPEVLEAYKKTRHSARRTGASGRHRGRCGIRQRFGRDNF